MDFIDPTYPDLAGALLALLWACAVAVVLTIAFPPRASLSDEEAMALWFIY
ncbi:hypothetical protein [Roseococcus sp.]|uniref:hypothetical protein n=1 Tax=Roseococcus sp. TaxID=2109646 RepID=UPI003BADAED3